MEIMLSQSSICNSFKKNTMISLVNLSPRFPSQIVHHGLQVKLLVPAPSDDRDPSLINVLVLRDLRDSVTPQDVDVASKSVDCPVGLRHRYNRPVTKRSRLVRASFKVVLFKLIVLFCFDGV